VDGPLYEPETNQVFIDELRTILRQDIPIIEVDAHINDPVFAGAAVSALDALMSTAKPSAAP
jgi:uncharacterized protein (UPF0261 family)